MAVLAAIAAKKDYNYLTKFALWKGNQTLILFLKSGQYIEEYEVMLANSLIHLIMSRWRNPTHWTHLVIDVVKFKSSKVIQIKMLIPDESGVTFHKRKVKAYITLFKSDIFPQLSKWRVRCS